MQMKISKTGIPARDAVLKGAAYVADAVRSTLGPFGLNALLEKGNRITNDGYTISSELCSSVKDEFERRGAIMLHEASSKTNDQVGDATTTSEVLALAITQEAIRFLPKEGTFISKKTPAEVLTMITASKENVIDLLAKQIKNIESEAELIHSAKVSVEDDELAELIGKAQWELGPDGFILAEETAEKFSSVQNVKGIRIDNGFGTSVMINNQEKQLLEVNDCAVILTNYTMNDLLPIEKVMNDIVKSGRRDIVVVARAFTPDFIRMAVENFKNGLHIYPINAPYTDQAEVMRDLQSVLGGTYIDSEESELKDMSLTDVGVAAKVVARRFDGVFTGVYDDKTKERVEKRVQQLKEKYAGSGSDFEKKSLLERISQLENGFALLKVGAKTETERKYKKDKCDDAVNAVRLALKGGTVPGAGIAFKEIAETLDDSDILKKPLRSINEQIMSSAPTGFVVEEWVRDPFLVLEASLTNACSIAGVLATTNVVVATKNKKECTHGTEEETN